MFHSDALTKELRFTALLLPSCFSGKYDHLPEAAFYMVGDIDDVIQKADKLAEELAAN